MVGLLHDFFLIFIPGGPGDLFFVVADFFRFAFQLQQMRFLSHHAGKYLIFSCAFCCPLEYNK
jgi:hypothetical protein